MKSDSSPGNVGNKQVMDKKGKKSAPPLEKRTLYAAVIATGPAVEKGSSVATAGSETKDATDKTRKVETSAEGRKTGAEATKRSETHLAPVKTVLPSDAPSVHESTKLLGPNEHGKAEMISATDSKQKPADVVASVPGPKDTTAAATHATKASETQASAATQAKQSMSVPSERATTVTATMKDSGVQSAASTIAADPPRHDETASKGAHNPLDRERPGAATGTRAVPVATVVANTASSSKGSADSRSSHGDKGKNGNFAAKNQVGPGQKEADASSTRSGLTGSIHNVKGSEGTSNPTQATSATGGTSAINASVAASSHAQNGQSPIGQAGSTATTASHDAPLAHAQTGRASGADNEIPRIQDARLISSASRAEMRVQLETNQLGPVQLHASVTGSRIGATISVDRPETQWLLASKLGVLHQALNDRNLRVDRIDVVSGPGANAGGQTGAGTSNGGGRAWHHGAGDSWTGTTSQIPVKTAAEETTTTSSISSPYRAGRLSVRA